MKQHTIIIANDGRDYCKTCGRNVYPTFSGSPYVGTPSFAADRPFAQHDPTGKARIASRMGG